MAYPTLADLTTTINGMITITPGIVNAGTKMRNSLVASVGGMKQLTDETMLLNRGLSTQIGFNEKLIELNFVYKDMKFDNFGYKLSENPIESDFRKQNVSKIFNKYLYIYFIDPASGLFSIEPDPEYIDKISDYIDLWDNFNTRIDYENYITKLNSVLDNSRLREVFYYYRKNKDKENAHDHIISDMNRGYDLSVHGQYYLSNINIEIKGDYNYDENKYNMLPISYSDDVIKILQKPYKYDIMKKEYKTIEDIILSLSLSL